MCILKSVELRPLAVPVLLLFTLILQTAARIDAHLQGSAVVPMGTNLPPIEISFLHRDGQEVDIYTIKSYGLQSTDIGFFKVEGAMNCVRYVSENKVIISGIAMGTAMNNPNFFRVGDTIMLAIATSDSNHPKSEVSVVNRIPYGLNKDCWDPDWTDFTLLHASEGEIKLLDV